MRGTTHLEGFLDAHYTAKMASGHTDPHNITFEEYVERLIQATKPHDASLGQSRGRGSRSVNCHLILGGESDKEDNSEDEEDPQATLEAHKSDWDRKSCDQKGKQGDK